MSAEGNFYDADALFPRIPVTGERILADERSFVVTTVEFEFADGFRVEPQVTVMAREGISPYR